MTDGEESPKECPVCTLLCELLGDKEKCKELTDKFNKGDITAEELDSNLKDIYGTAKVDLAKAQLKEEMNRDA